MSDPKRLFESSESEVERLLLRAGRERAPRGAKRRALAAATGVIAASTLTAGKATGATIAGKAAAGAKAASLLSLKWIVVASVASVGMVAGTVAVRALRAERAESAAVAVQARSAAPVTARASLPPVPAQAPVPTQALVPVAPVPAASASVPVDPPASVASATPGPSPIAVRSIAPSARPTASAGSTSTAELMMLDQARTSIAQGDAAGGLSILDAYASKFAHPVMGPEASILRIEALVKTGDRAAAKREGDTFLRTNPSSPYAPRIRSLLGASNP